MGRSKMGPSFLMSAGAKFTVVRPMWGRVLLGLATPLKFFHVHLILAPTGCGFVSDQVLVANERHVEVIQSHSLTPPTTR